MFEDVGDAALKRYLEDCAKASALDPNLAFKITKGNCPGGLGPTRGEACR